MMFFRLVFIVCFKLGAVIDYVNGQGVTPAGDPYFCAPPGICYAPGTGGDATGIDPRIVTPAVAPPCPPGTIPCYAQGANSTCGQRFIPSTNVADGPANNGAYPWEAYLRNLTHPFAGSGVLLSPYHVLTAAHKVQASVANPAGLTVIMGVFNPSAIVINPQTSSVAKRIVLHPLFNVTGDTLRDDLAVIVLQNPITLFGQQTINTACLPVNGRSFIGQRCVVSGWGQTGPTIVDAPTSPMKQVFVNIVDYNTCSTGFTTNTPLLNVAKYLDPQGEICAGGQAVRDACFQDGGAPLVCLDATNSRYYVAGLVIWGKSCGLNGVYGVYVNVPYYMSSFIIPTITAPV